MRFHGDFFSDLLALESGPRDSNVPWNGILNASSETAGPFYCRFACNVREIEGERARSSNSYAPDLSSKRIPRRHKSGRPRIESKIVRFAASPPRGARVRASQAARACAGTHRVR